MAIFTERYIVHLHLTCLMMADHLYARYLDDRATDAFLVWYREVSYRLILSASLSDLTFHFFGFLCELLRDGSELTSLVSELIRLIFRGLDFFL